MVYPNLFKNRYPLLKGKNWLQTVSPEDKRAFIEIGLHHALNGVLGGIARSTNGKRDKRGRFVKEL
jgi:hypothetical protein